MENIKNIQDRVLSGDIRKGDVLMVKMESGQFVELRVAEADSNTVMFDDGHILPVSEAKQLQVSEESAKFGLSHFGYVSNITKLSSVYMVRRMIKDGKLTIGECWPWSREKKIEFIKSLLMGLPVGMICVRDNYSISHITDGAERIKAIDEYIKGLFSIDGVFYDDLDREAVYMILSSVILVVTVTDTDTEAQNLFAKQFVSITKTF